MTKLKVYVALALAAILLVLGFSMYSCATKAKPAPVVPQAQVAIKKAQTQEATLEPKIATRAAAIVADVKAVAHDVAGFKHPALVPAPAPGTALSLEEPLGAPPVVAHDPKDQALIDDQAKLISDQAAQITNLTQDRDAYKAEALASRDVIAAQNARLAAQPPVRNWGVAVIYGTNQTAGGGVEYTYHAVSVGVDVVRRQIGGGQTTLEALGRAVIRF